MLAPNKELTHRLNTYLSSSFQVHRGGIYPGFPLKDTGHGLQVLGLDMGSSAHADDIRVVTTVQGNLCTSTSLTLNANKTEAVTFSQGPRTELMSLTILSPCNLMPTI